MSGGSAEAVEKEIQAELDAIEREHDVKILLACESGSRAWGFPSQDSDFDVRFLCAHTRDWYLSVFEKRDVIEKPVSGLLDISGWDIRKALQLLRKSNPALMEWLTSPLVYRSNPRALAPLLDLAEQAFRPMASCHHYISMAKGHVARFEGKDHIRVKVYLYTLRPILCCRWVIECGSQPPMLFRELLERFLPSGEVREVVDHLVALKSQSNETDTVPRSAVLEDHMREQLATVERQMPSPDPPPPMAVFDETFREILNRAESSI
jgi:uncharacterized protein